MMQENKASSAIMAQLQTSMVETNLRSEQSPRAASLDASDGKRSGPSPAANELAEAALRASIDKMVEGEDKATGCVNAMFTLLELFGYRERKGDASRERTIAFWKEAAASLGDGGWMKYAKWKFADLFYHYGPSQLDSMPPLPEGLQDRFVSHNVYCSGRAGRYAQALRRGPYRLQFAASILQLKKGCPRPSNDLVDKAVLKTVAALTTNPPKAPRWVPLVENFVELDALHGVLSDSGQEALTIETVKRQLVRTVFELFEGHSYDDLEKFKPYFPSTSASYWDKRKHGGAFASIRKLAKAFNLQNLGKPPLVELRRNQQPARSVQPENRDIIGEDVSSEMYMHGQTEWIEGSPHPDLPHEVILRRRREGGVPRYRTTVRPFYRSEYASLTGVERDESISSKSSGVPEFEADITRLESRFRRLYEAAVKAGLSTQNPVTPVGLKEALKVRIITKGDPYSSFALKPLQRFLWRVLKAHPVFTLIGEPVNAKYIQAQLGKKLNDDEAYLSGDYSAATDNLAPWVSETIAHAIAARCKLTEDEWKLFVRALTRHTFYSVDDDVIPQRWGQLMGSVISFPVLCIANAALCRWALELDYNRPMTLRQCPLMVNGDDCAARCRDRGLRFWKQITTFAGLTPSIGKFFFSREFVQINSTNYERLKEPTMMLDSRSDGVEVQRELWFRQTEFFNLGLLAGFKRSGELTEELKTAELAGEDSLGARFRDFLSQVPWDFRVTAYMKFLNSSRLQLADVRVPWFIPEQLGGVGLPWLQDYSDIDNVRFVKSPGGKMHLGPSDLDRRVCSLLIKHPDWFPTRKPPASTPWNVHRLAMKRLGGLKAELVSPTIAQQARYDRVYGAIVVDSMFTDKDCFGTTKQNRVGLLRQNERSWEKALLHLKSHQYPPISLSVLAQSVPAQPIVDFEVVSAV